MVMLNETKASVRQTIERAFRNAGVQSSVEIGLDVAKVKRKSLEAPDQISVHDLPAAISRRHHVALLLEGEHGGCIHCAVNA